MSDEFREKLADLCHRQWSGWMAYLFEKCKPLIGTDHTVMPGEFVDRWKRQLSTPYKLLYESEQDSDRKEADKFIELLKHGEKVSICKHGVIQPADVGEFCIECGEDFVKTGYLVCVEEIPKLNPPG